MHLLSRAEPLGNNGQGRREGETTTDDRRGEGANPQNRARRGIRAPPQAKAPPLGRGEATSEQKHTKEPRPPNKKTPKQTNRGPRGERGQAPRGQRAQKNPGARQVHTDLAPCAAMICSEARPLGGLRTDFTLIPILILIRRVIDPDGSPGHLRVVPLAH
jgi:hypothetical protein